MNRICSEECKDKLTYAYYCCKNKNEKQWCDTVSEYLEDMYPLGSDSGLCGDVGCHNCKISENRFRVVPPVLVGTRSITETGR